MSAPRRVAPIDLSGAAEPADEHIAHALQLVRCAPLLSGAHQRITVEAVRDRLVSALAAIDAGRYTTAAKVTP